MFLIGLLGVGGLMLKIALKVDCDYSASSSMHTPELCVFLVNAA
jgi:hypothetical protein